MKKLNLMKLMAAFICVILLSSCGSPDGPDPIPLPNDNFSSYTTFPTNPWYVFDGSDTTTANWTITNSGGNYSANYVPTLPTYVALINNNYYSRSDSTVIARMKVVTPNSLFGIFQRITTDDVTQSSHSSYYQLIISSQTNTIYFTKVVLGSSSGLVSGNSIIFPGGFDPTTYHDYKLSITGSGIGTLTLTCTIDGGGAGWTVSDTDDGSLGTPILAWGYSGFYFSAVDNGSITHYQVTQP